MIEGLKDDPLQLFGRAEELARLAALFESERLVTLLGPGGIGKTSLAVCFAKRQGTTPIVDWSEARDRSTALVSLAHAVGGARAAAPMESIEAALTKSAPNLLVIDNCEQIIDEAAEIIAHLLRSVPALRVLATSRELLKIEREVVFAIEPLAIAQGNEKTSMPAAIELFVDRATRARAGYSYGADSQFVSAIVERLEGIPLAIELAAARMRVLDAKAILERLDAPFELLRSGPRSAPERQRTLRAVIEGSWTPLSPFEQTTLAQCSVFRGGFTIEAAESVVRIEGEDAPSVLDLIQSLADKSLLRTVEPPGFTGEIRFQFFETIRELAAEKLAIDREYESAQERHRAYFLETGSQWEANHWHGGMDTVRRLALERENLLEARAHAMVDTTPRGSTDLIRSAIALHPIFAALGPFSESPALLERARMDACLASATQTLKARFFLVRGRAEQLAGNSSAGRVDFEEALARAREASDERLEARALVHLATTDRAAGNFKGARDRFEAALGRFEACGDEVAASIVLSAIGALHLQSGDLESARKSVARASEIQRILGDRATLGMMLIDLGIIEQELGSFDSARARLDEARTIHDAIDNKRFFAVATGYRANLDLEEERMDAARDGYRAAISVLGLIGDIKFESLFAAGLASIESDWDAFDRIESRTRGRVEPRISAAIALHRARSEWMHECRQQKPGEARWIEARRRAEDKRAASAGLERESDDVRFALRLLDRALDESSVRENAPSRTSVNAALRVARDGTSFRTGDGETCDLSRRESARRIVLALVRRRVDSPGTTVSARDLIDAGWPGERMSESAAKNRLHVTLTKLRESGLRKLLVSRDGGHLIDPDASVIVERD